MIERCPKCNANLAMVGRAHLCRPLPEGVCRQSPNPFQDAARGRDPAPKSSGGALLAGREATQVVAGVEEAGPKNLVVASTNLPKRAKSSDGGGENRRPVPRPTRL